MTVDPDLLFQVLQEYATSGTDALAQLLVESFKVPPGRAREMAKLPLEKVVEKLVYTSTVMNMSMKEHAETERAHFQTEYQPVFAVLIPHVKAFLEKHAAADASNNNKSTGDFSALDIGSGYGIGTVTMALTLRAAHPKSKLEWHPSDWDAASGGSMVEQQTREMLRYLVKESQESSAPLFTDKNDEPVFIGNAIELGGLKTAQFNGERGHVQGPDANAPGRFAIQLSPDPKDCKSFKHQNITYVGEPTMHDAVWRRLRIENKEEEFFQGLLERTRALDILKHETWSNVEDLRGNCALLTCTNLLTCLGYRDPTAWQDTMQLAADLLHVDGHLLQYDGIGFADFGDDSFMQSFANDKSLGLELVASNVGVPCGERQRKVMLWRKL